MDTGETPQQAISRTAEAQEHTKVNSYEISEELARMVAKLDNLTRRASSSHLAGQISLLQRHMVVEAQKICNLARRIENGDLP